GTHYSWSPATWLSNPNIADPDVNNPGNPVNITYRLKVTDANGCESSTDEVKITFAAPATVFIEADSSVAINQPVQLNAIDKNNSDFIDYRWSPVYGLNNPFIKDPVARLDKDMTYTVQASNKYHCTATAHISIKVFRGPEIYVPNSFTPNGDGLNDFLKPVPVGLVEFHYLKIFNRFGHLLFTITDPARGWDGRIQGVEQNSGTYVWIAEGVDYKGNLIMRKGYSTLIR
ncbi:MAG TPA: gliding motility-associated C-terminal domain-containing protein, partial [Ferruginibacter sp.]|nr:gliding motility-associated C-terminal domain-containing protein [Ferruginibacter sp.]